MNHHGIVTSKREIFFMSFKGDAKKSSLDQVTLPPEKGIRPMSDGTGMWHVFGEWLARYGHGWEYAEDEQICRWAIEYWNASLVERDLPRRFDRMATAADKEAAGVREYNPRARRR